MSAHHRANYATYTHRGTFGSPGDHLRARRLCAQRAQQSGREQSREIDHSRRLLQHGHRDRRLHACHRASHVRIFLPDLRMNVTF